MSDRFDLIVIGAGSGGLAAAKRAAAHGARVAVIEGDRVGGTCVIRGCVPKKLLVYGSAVRQQLVDAEAYGWRLADGASLASAARPDPAMLLGAVRAEVDRLNGLHEQLLAKAGVTLVRGWGCFSDPHSLLVRRADGSEQTLRGEQLLIAVGGRPQRPAIPGADLGWVSDDLFDLEQLPDHVVVVGAGFIACEFAGILRGLGVQVSQVVRGARLLRGFDHELADDLRQAMEQEGIALRFSRSPQAISGEPGALQVQLDQGESIACGGVLLATGRRPFLQNLGLEAAGVAVEADRIPVDADQTTNIPHIHAIGDVTDRVNLTPVAIDEGRALADRLFANRQRRVDHQLVAKAVFSQPELASVGLSEDEAIDRLGAEHTQVLRARFRPMAQALPGRGPRVLLKLVLDRRDRRVVGCHMFGDHAAEIIQMAAIPIGMGATKEDFDRTMALHPSVAEEFVTMVG